MKKFNTIISKVMASFSTVALLVGTVGTISTYAANINVNSSIGYILTDKMYSYGIITENLDASCDFESNVYVNTITEGGLKVLRESNKEQYLTTSVIGKTDVSSKINTIKNNMSNVVNNKNIDFTIKYYDNQFYLNNRQVDRNNIEVNVTQLGKTIVFSVSAETLSYLGTDAIKIIKSNNQNVIFNVNGSFEYLSLNRIKINGSDPNDNYDLNSTLYFFFNDKNQKNINLVNVAGVVIAPQSTITLGGTGSGWLIAKEVYIGGGEWHGTIKRNPPSEEPTTTQPETTTKQQETTTKPVETTTQAVTTKPVETTTQIVTTKPVETTTQIVTTKPIETTTQIVTTKPVETTTQPVTTKPVETTTAEKTTTVPETSTTIPEVTTTYTETTSAEESTTEQETSPYVEETTTKAAEVEGDEETTPSSKRPEVEADTDLFTGDNALTSLYLFLLAAGLFGILYSITSLVHKHEN